MYEESINEYSFDQFSESYSMPGMMDDLEIAQEQAPAELKKESNQFAIAGLITLLSGAGLYLAMNLDKLGLGSLTALKENLMPFVVLAGIGGLGYGLLKVWRRVFRKGRLNFPKLQIRRKFFPNERRQTRQRNDAPRWNQRLQNVVGQAPNSNAERLSLSEKKVFLGVAAGLAENSRLPVSLIRLLFIGAFGLTGGFALVLYVLLGIFLPSGKKLNS